MHAPRSTCLSFCFAFVFASYVVVVVVVVVESELESVRRNREYVRMRLGDGERVQRVKSRDQGEQIRELTSETRTSKGRR